MLLCIHATVKSHAKIKDRLRNAVLGDQPWFVPLHCEITGSIFSAGIGAVNTKAQSLRYLCRRFYSPVLSETGYGMQQDAEQGVGDTVQDEGNVV